MMSDRPYPQRSVQTSLTLALRARESLVKALNDVRHLDNVAATQPAIDCAEVAMSALLRQLIEVIEDRTDHPRRR
jgi:hypothetical protein